MVKYPWFRSHLIDVLKTLSNREIQEKEWGYSNPHSEGAFAIDMHLLLDDTALFDNPYGEVGSILEDDEEARLIGLVTELIVTLFDKIGNNLPVAKYQKHPDWSQIMNAAEHTLGYIKQMES